MYRNYFILDDVPQKICSENTVFLDKTKNLCCPKVMSKTIKMKEKQIFCYVEKPQDYDIKSHDSTTIVTV